MTRTVEQPPGTAPSQAPFRVEDLPPAAPPPQGRRSLWRRPPGIALVVLIVVAAVTAVALVLSDSGEPPPPPQPPAEPQAAIVGAPMTGIARGSSDMTVYEDLMWITNYDESTVYVVDPAARELVDEVAMPYSSMLRVEPGLGAIWLDGSTTTVARIDAQTHQAVEIDLPASDEQRLALAIGEENVWVASLDSRTVYQIDAVAREVVGQRRYAAPINEVTAGSGMLFVLDVTGVLRFVDEQSGDVVGKLDVGDKWSGIEYEDGVAYVTKHDDDDTSITPVDVETRSAGAPIELGKGLWYWEVAAGRIWATYPSARLVRQFDADSGAQLGEAVLVPGKPAVVNTDADGQVWVVLANGKIVQISPDGSGEPVAPAEPIETIAPAEPTETVAPEPTETAVPEPTYVERVTISIGWTENVWDSDSSYAHFKAVDSDGDKVAEIPGSVSVDLEESLDTLHETPELRDFVDRLRAKLESAGWDELGVAQGGEWYEYEFGR